MRKILLFSIVALIATAFSGCDDGKCHISGTIPENYNGKKIFLVPFTNDSRFNVDSVVIRDGKFAFERDTLMLAKIILDYHYRIGVEPLLVVVEPGQINVVIDSVSHATGTPQNDSLDLWKGRKLAHDMQIRLMGAQIAKLRAEGDTVAANQMKAQSDSLHLAFKNYTRQMAANLGSGTLYDFLSAFYPKTYKRVMPDSTVVEFDADTNEPIR